jgi:hypothetical protein
VLRVREAVDDPPLVPVESVMPLAHRQVEAEGVHESNVRTSAVGRRDSDLMLPAKINRGSGELAFPLAHGRPIDSVFSFCSHDARRSPDVNASERSTESEAETAAVLEAEVDEAIASCGGDVRAPLRATLIANTYLEAEVERLTEAISTGFARGRMRKAPQRVKKI